MRRYLALTILGVGLLAAPAWSQYPPPPGAGAAAGGAQQLVDSWYQHFLNRQRDAYGSVWIDALQQGQPPEAVLSKILGSQEYFDKGGGTPEGFINTLYLDATGRQPSPQETQAWVQRLYQTDRNDVAYQILTRYPQSWQAGVQPGYNPGQPSYNSSYDYRPPYYPYRR